MPLLFLLVLPGVSSAMGLASTRRISAPRSVRRWSTTRQGANQTEVDSLVGLLAPAAGRYFPGAETALAELSALYEGRAIDPFYIEKDLGFDKGFAEAGDAGLYGEMLPSSVIGMLAGVNARPGMRYYDLGSGFGKTVVLAGLLGLQATGVELVDHRWDAACNALLRAQSSFRPGQVKMVHGSILEFDFSDADIVFTDSLAFSDSMMDSLSQAARRLRPGSRIITAVPLDRRWFKDTGKFVGPSSWLPDSEWIIQEPRPEASAEAVEVSRAKQRPGVRQEAEIGFCSS